jgi:nicotinamidase-related amidase
VNCLRRRCAARSWPLAANTCVESTGRYAMEMGYPITLVTDVTAAFSKDAMHAAHVVNGWTCAHAMTATAELITLLLKKS